MEIVRDLGLLVRLRDLPLSRGSEAELGFLSQCPQTIGIWESTVMSQCGWLSYDSLIIIIKLTHMLLCTYFTALKFSKIWPYIVVLYRWRTSLTLYLPCLIACHSTVAMPPEAP